MYLKIKKIMDSFLAAMGLIVLSPPFLCPDYLDQTRFQRSGSVQTETNWNS